MIPAVPDPDPLLDGGFATQCAHYGEHRLGHAGAAAPPIYQTSTFVYPDATAFAARGEESSPWYTYTRVANPTTRIFEAKLARLEHGRWARCFSSGMGAISAALNANVAGGTHVVAVWDCYQPTRRYLDHLARFAVATTYVRGTETAAFVAALRPETRVLYLESPTTGRFDILDVPALAAAARERGIVTIFDNSWASPCFQTPLDFGVDLVLHSATKYLGGHSDVVGGVVAGADAELQRRVLLEGELGGASADPFAAWLLIRGLRTLELRMQQHQRSGLALAELLARHPRVLRIYHPACAGPQQALARRQLRGYAGLFSFALREQTEAATRRFMDRLRLFSLGVSWGGFESLVVGGRAAELFNGNADEPEWIIRLHAGLESTDDLVNDVRRALED